MELGLQGALPLVMSLYDLVYKKMAVSFNRGDAGRLDEPAQKFDPARHISPGVAHELNNALTVVQCYADSLLLKHAEDGALQPHLKRISEASRRASMIVRDAMAKK